MPANVKMLAMAPTLLKVSVELPCYRSLAQSWLTMEDEPKTPSPQKVIAELPRIKSSRSDSENNSRP